MSRRSAPIAVSILVLGGGVAAAGPPAPPPGALDPTFHDGVAQLPAPSQLFGAAVQADGKLVAAGQRDGRVTVVRFTEKGLRDDTFNRDGIYDGPQGAAHGVAIDSLGRILVAATTTEAGLTAIRLTPNGGPDSSFSEDGIVVAGSRLPGGEGLDLAFQGDAVVVVGAATTPEGKGVAVARFTNNGGLDGSFTSDGARIYDFGNSTANAVAIDSEGKIVLAGSQVGGGQLSSVLAARLNRNGYPDPDFGNIAGVPGLFVRAFQRAAPYSEAFDVRVDDEDRPVLAGVALNGLPVESSRAGSDAIAVRLTSRAEGPDSKAGVPDTSFSDDGVAYRLATTNKDQSSQPAPYPGAYGVTLGGGDIILGGFFEDLGRKQLALLALNQNGRLDRSFGSDGLSSQGFDNESGKFNALAIAGDGGLFGVGDLQGVSGGDLAGLAAKYVGVGKPPPVPASTSLAPSAIEPTVGTEDCVTATVADQNGAPLSEIEVIFRVIGVNSPDGSPLDGSQLTDANGEARFCYIGQSVGPDTIRAGPKVRLASASKTWVRGSPPGPELSESVNVTPPETGTVLVSLPDGGGFVPIERVSQLPVGSVIDSSRGKVNLTIARNRQGRLQRGQFGGGVFKIRQPPRRGGLTVLALRGGDFSRCRRGAGGSSAARASKLVIRRLNASARRGGRYRTPGRYSAATVRGTVWDVIDRCDGTLTRVRAGTVVVRDFKRHRTVVVHAGDSYLAKAPGG